MIGKALLLLLLQRYAELSWVSIFIVEVYAEKNSDCLKNGSANFNFFGHCETNP